MKAYYRHCAPGALFVLLTAGIASATTPTSTTLTIGPSPGTAGSPITLTATISPQGTPPLPTGTVSFSEASSPTIIYTSPVINGAATLLLEPPAGSYIYTAVYSGDSTYAGSTSLPVNEQVTSSTTTTLTVIPNPTLFGAPATLTATVTPNTATGSVTFYDLSNVLGVAPVVGGVATFTAIPLPSGLRTIYARYSGDNVGDAPSTSSTVSEAVIAKAGLGYGAPTLIPTGTAPLVQVTGDFNRDGITDLAVLNAGTSTIQIFLGTSNGTGAFTVGNTLTTGTLPLGLVAGDFNGDGNVDLAVAASDGVEVLYGAGGGVFNSYVTTSIGGAASTLTVADFNNDGLPDIAATSGTTLSVLISTGPAFNTGLFTPVTLGAAAVASGIGDFNGDALADLVVITSAGANVMLNTSNLNAVTPTYSFATPVIYAAGNGPNAVLVKDVTGSTNQDLLITNFTDGTVSVLIGNGSGTFSSEGTFPAGPEPTSLASCDFNGDGIADLVVTNGSTYNGTSNISILLGNGNGTYHQPLGYSAGSGPSSVIVADFNDDNKPDLAVLSSSGNELEILLNLYATLTVTAGNTQSVAINNTFAVPLQVTAAAFGTPAANVTVTFTAPASGAGGFFEGTGGSAQAISSAAGVATAPSFTANTTPGSFTVSASAGGGNSVPFSLTNNAQTCSFQVSPTTPIVLDANGGSQLFTVTTSLPSCMWNAASPSPSVLFGTTAGTGNGTVEVLFPENNTGQDLPETVLIAGIPIYATILATKQVFVDVPPTAYYFDAVNLMYAKGITAGCSSSPMDFCPTDAVTRAEMAIFIVTAVYNGSDFTLNNSSPYFSDVPVGSFGYNYIQKMYELGITAGCGGSGSNLLFCPNDSVNRVDMAIFIIKARYGANVSFDYPTTPYFTDVPTGAFGFEYVQRMAEDGITAGCSPTTFCPTETVDRGDMAVFVMKGMYNDLYPVTTPEILSISPASILTGQTTTITVTGTNTSFGVNTVLEVNPAYTIGALNVISPTSLTVQLTPVNGVVTTQPYSIFIETSEGPNPSQEEVLPNGLTIVQAP